MNYKQQSLNRKLPTCEYVLTDVLDHLFRLCLKLHTICHSRFKEYVRNGQFSVKDISPTDSEKLDSHVSETFFWTLEVFGANGEYLHVIDAGSFRQEDLPLRISKIRIRNDQWYELKNKMKPCLYFDLTIDFNTFRILDLVTPATHSTKNESRCLVSGINGVDVKGLSEEFAQYFKKHENLNYLINSENVYDFLLWILVVPLLLFYLTNSRDHIPQRVLESATPIQLIFSIAFFFQTLIFFRLIFNIGRWFFPCQELTTQTSYRRRIVKWIFSLSVAGLVGTLAYNGGALLFSKLFG